MMSELINTKSKKILTGTLLLLAMTVSGGRAEASNALGDPASRVAGKNASGVIGLSAVVAETKSGDITLGSTNQVVVKFRNDSGQELKVGEVSLYPSSTVSTEVALNECVTIKEPMPVGAECAIVVSVKGLKTGNWRVEMLVRHDGKSKIVTAALTGTVTAGDDETDVLLSDVEAIPNEIDFGSISSSRPLVKSVVLRNVTSTPIKVQKVSVEASPQSGYTLGSDCQELKPGQACLTTITWSPVTSGQSDGVLVVEHDGPTRVASVTLKGDYNPKVSEKADIFPEAVPGAGLLVSSLEEINFGSITNEASMTVSLVNVGDQELQIKDISIGSSDKGLTLSETGCRANTVLEPVAACALTLKWSPVKTGEIFEDIRISHDGARGILVIPVRGTSSVTVNRDTKAVVVSNDDGKVEPVIKTSEKKQALDGFVITSHSGSKAIINGPGGSRVISNGQDLILGGIQWKVTIVDNGIEFMNAKDRVMLLFDQSLSASGRTGSSSSSSTSTTTPSSTSSTSTTTAQ